MHNSKVRISQDLLQSSTELSRADGRALLLIGGLDPSGEAGLGADLATLGALGWQPRLLTTVLTAQASGQWRRAEAVDARLLAEQAELLAHSRPAAVKIGALGPGPARPVVLDLLQALRAADPTLPIVVDPVLRSSSGGALGRAADYAALAPLATVLLPNGAEWRELATLCAGEPAPRLHTDAPPGAWLEGPGLDVRYRYSRRAGEFRGSGCTLATLVAAALAGGAPLPRACALALAQLQAWLAASTPPLILRRPPALPSAPPSAP